jgi:ribosomal protein L40E
MQDFTDSYCERCGTRYTFGQPKEKKPAMATARTLARGLKHFVMNDSSTIDDAMAAARIDEERQSAAQITEEFHKVFSFCMTCRQYACEKCWNPNQSACLSCAPLWDTEPVAPEGHLIIRTPTTSHSPAAQQEAPSQPETDLEEILRQRSADLAAADTSHRTAGETRRQARRDEKAAAKLRAQSETWKAQDDGWTLWPSDQAEAASPLPAPPPPASRPPQPAPSEMNLTPDELQLVQSELDTPPYQEPDEPRPKRGGRSSGGRAPTQPEAAPPSSDFDPLGSLSQPADATPPAVPPQPKPRSKHGPVLGRLLGGQRPAADAEAGQARAKPARGGRSGKSRRGSKTEAARPAEPWPHVTPWAERPIAHHDWSAEPEAATAPQQQAPEEPQISEAPAPAERLGPVKWEEPPPWQEPVPQQQEPVPQPPVQGGSQFEQSPASWLAAAKRSPEPAQAQPAPQAPEPPPAPSPAPPQETPAAAPPSSRPAAPAEQSQLWPPVGTQWPPKPTPEAASWPAANADVAASMAARNQLNQAAQDEAALVSAMWAESAQRVMDKGSARVCYRCALPLSMHARYCRRCGTNQQG